MKKTLSIILAFLLIASGCIISSSYATTNKYEISSLPCGTIVEFGTYPQTLVNDKTLISALNSLSSSIKWISYGYTSGTGTKTADIYNGSAEKSDYMKYCDVQYNNQKYRGVIIETYRPWYSNYKSTASHSDTPTEQNINGYSLGVAYWFKYELLKWRVLDPNEGLLVCEQIVDSQPINDSVYYLKGKEYYQTEENNIYASNYFNSSVRSWLNSHFYDTAFSNSEKIIIQSPIRENKACPGANSHYDSLPSSDKVTLLTYEDITNENYGFSSDIKVEDVARRASGTDYSKCQNLMSTKVYVDSNGNYSSMWWLRSARFQNITCAVNKDGTINTSLMSTDITYVGIRPAINIYPNEKLTFISNNYHKHNYKSELTSAPTCTKSGSKTFTCTCGNCYTEVVAKLSHIDKDNNGCCDLCNLITDQSKNTISKINISVPTHNKTIDYKNKLKISASVKGLPSGYFVKWFEGNKIVSDDITFITNELVSNHTYVAKVVDKNNKIVSSDRQNQEVKISVNSGLFKKIKAFFIGLFGEQPVVNL